MTPLERVARAMAEAEGYYLGKDAAKWAEHWAWYLAYRGQGGSADHSNHARWYRQATAALAIVRAICVEECAAIRREGHVTDSDAEHEHREQRALVAWRLAQVFAPEPQGGE